MTATGLLIIVIGAFVLFNADNIIDVFQGKVRLNLPKREVNGST